VTAGAAIQPEDIDGSFVPRPGSWVAAVELDGEAVLMDETTGALHLLDDVATVIWSRIDGSATLDELTAELSEVFTADPDQVRADLLAFSRQLGEQHLLDGIAAATGWREVSGRARLDAVRRGVKRA